MQAVVLTRYGALEELAPRTVGKPVPKGGSVRVEVRASAVNDWDWALVRGKPLYIRAIAGWTRPKIGILGCEIAGRVDAVGGGVEQFEVGDDVHGDLSGSGFGGFAEYVCVPEGSLALKPRNLTYEEAAALPHAGMLAQQSLRDIGRVDSAHTLLINGAGGGVGTLALQLAKRHGVEVTGVDSPAKQDFLRRLGFDHVIDYTKEDFTRKGVLYDLILDVKTLRSPFACVRALNRGGTYVTVGGSPARLLECFALGPLIGRMRGRHVRVLALRPNDGLDELTVLVEAGTVAPSIDAVYPLRDVAAAIQRFGEASHEGKIVLRTS